MSSLLDDSVVRALIGGAIAIIGFLGWGAWKELQGRKDAKRQQALDDTKKAEIAWKNSMEDDAATRAERRGKTAALDDLPTAPTKVDQILERLRRKRQGGVK